jgi:opacity protein-like surface antigen
MRLAALVCLALLAGFPARAQPAGWPGAYGGLNFGGADGAVDAANPFRGVSFTNSTNAKGPLWGVQAGYNFQDGALVYGVEATAEMAGLTGTATCLSGVHLGRCKPQVNAFGTLAARLGIADGANLFYARAGAAWMSDRESYLLFDYPPASAQARYDRLGFAMGAGLEHRIGADWSLRFDYQYLGFYNTAFAFATPRAIDFAAGAHVLTLGVNYHLDAAGPTAPGFATLTTPEDEPGAWAFEIGGRLFAAVGNMKKDFDEVPGNENSRLTWQGMPVATGEIFARADHRSGWFIAANYGLGVISGGGLYDEDTPYAGFGNGNYSNTITRVSKGSLAYQSIDAGFNVIDRDDLRLGLFTGYGHLRFKGPGFGCEQLANNNYLGRPAGFFAPDYNIITETDDWHAARLGVNSRIALMDRLSLTAEIAYLPYVFLHGIDHHIYRDIIFAAHGAGDGVQLEGTLEYALNGNLSLGVGGRYWEWHAGGATVSCQGACNDTFPRQTYTDPPWGAPYDMHLFGGFAQLSYRFGRTAHDAAAGAPEGFTWSGPYLGVAAGARAGEALWHTDCLSIPCVDGESSRNQNAVPMGGVAGYAGALGGYLWTVAPDWLLGAEADFGWANNSRTERNIWVAYLANVRARPDDPATVRQNWDASLRLRGGLLVTPDTFAYATIGLALTGARASASCSGLPGYWCIADRSDSTSGARLGFTLGAGAETALDDGLSLRLEYRYTDTGALRHRFFADAPPDAVAMRTDLADQRLLLALIWRP